MQNTKREAWLDCTKGFAAILVVIGHIADGYFTANLYPYYNSFITIIYNMVYSFHMPLFFMLSGSSFGVAYVEGNKEYNLRKKHIKVQIGNLIVLYFEWCVILWGFKQYFSEYVNREVSFDTLLQIPLKAISPYWYLYVLVICYLVTYFLISQKVKEKYILICSAILCVMQYWIQTPFTATGIVAYYFFFYAGLLIGKNEEILMKIGKPSVLMLNAFVGGIIGCFFSFSRREEMAWGVYRYWEVSWH